MSEKTSVYFEVDKEFWDENVELKKREDVDRYSISQDTGLDHISIDEDGIEISTNSKGLFGYIYIPMMPDIFGKFLKTAIKKMNRLKTLWEATK